MDKTALVTGGAGGLGGVTSRTLANNGWHVFVADFDDAALQAFAGNPAFTPIKIDVTKTESVKEAYQQVAKNSDTLSAIVNFAGVLAVGSMIEIEETALQRVLDVNLMGTFRVNKAFFPLLQQGSSRIVNISSETGWQSRQIQLVMYDEDVVGRNPVERSDSGNRLPAAIHERRWFAKTNSLSGHQQHGKPSRDGSCAALRSRSRWQFDPSGPGVEGFQTGGS